MDREDFKIDETRIDRELIRQPQLQRQVGEEKADAQHVRNQMKANYEVACAQLSLAIRSDPEKYGLRAKPTVDEVGHALVLQREYQAALTQLNLADYQLDIASASVVAMIDRRKSLEGYVTLISINYATEKDVRPKTYEGRQRINDAERHEIRGEGVNVNLDD